MIKSFTLRSTKGFDKAFKKLMPAEQKTAYTKLALLSTNPAHPSLRRKKLRGHENKYECSINMDIRVIWEYLDDKTIILTDIGHHDVLDRY